MVKRLEADTKCTGYVPFEVSRHFGAAFRQMWVRFLELLASMNAVWPMPRDIGEDVVQWDAALPTGRQPAGRLRVSVPP